METRRNLLVGAFVLAMLAALIAWLAVLGGRTGASDPYHAHYDNVMGIAAGTKVFFEGYHVGMVDSVGPSPEAVRRFRIDLVVTDGWPIPEDSVAEVLSSGLLSPVVMNIRAGPSTRMLAPGSEIAGGSPQGVVAALSSFAEDVTGLIERNVRPLLEQIGQDTPQILANALDITEEIQKTARGLSDIVSSENKGHVDNILIEADGAAGTLRKMATDLHGTRQRLDDLLAGVDALVEENRGPVSETLVELRDTLEAISPRVDAITRNLEVATRHLSEFSLQIRENPGVLVRGRASSDGDAP